MISVFTVVPQNPKEREDTVVEGVKAALNFADEIICYHHNPKDGTLPKLYNLKDKRIKFIDGGAWEVDRFVVGRSKNAALQHCTQDWCLLMDADEVFKVPNPALLRKFLAQSPEANAFRLRYLHFYRDPSHIKTGEGWYMHKPSLMRNHNGNFIGGWRIMSNTEMNKFGRPLNEDIKTGWMPEELLTVFHYGHCKTNVVTYGKKKNNLEATYGEDGRGQTDPTQMEWNMEGTEEFIGEHPEEMSERLKAWQTKNL
jgi:hypothetical protein